MKLSQVIEVTHAFEPTSATFRWGYLYIEEHALDPDAQIAC